MTGDNYILKTALTYLMKVGKNVWRKTNLRKDFIYLTYKDFTVQDDLFFFFFLMHVIEKCMLISQAKCLFSCQLISIMAPTLSVLY